MNYFDYLTITKQDDAKSVFIDYLINYKNYTVTQAEQTASLFY